jgi:hypothetical protein
VPIITGANKQKIRTEQEKKETDPSILALFIFMDDLMLSHHELASTFFTQ